MYRDLKSTIQNVDYRVSTRKNDNKIQQYFCRFSKAY